MPGSLPNFNAPAPVHPARYPQHDRTLHPDKGDFNGECNVTACSERGATWFNRATLGHYCERHARLINEAAVDRGMEPLCTLAAEASA